MDKNRKEIKIIPGFVCVLVAWNFLSSCGPSAKKLDEATFHDGPKFKLKLVRYDASLPLHYIGEVFRVLCSSANTQTSPGHRTQDAGWVTLGNGGAIGSKSADELVEREHHNYIMIDENTLVWTGIGYHVSFDACGKFRGWYPTSLSDELFTHIEKPSNCKPKGEADCRHYDFMGDRLPHYEKIQVKTGGHLSFTVRSKAFSSEKGFNVESTDFGSTWIVKSTN